MVDYFYGLVHYLTFFNSFEVEPLRMSLRSRRKAGDGQLADSQEFLSLDLNKSGINIYHSII